MMKILKRRKERKRKMIWAKSKEKLAPMNQIKNEIPEKKITIHNF